VRLQNKGITGVETINIKHDYFRIWNMVLAELNEEFASILEEESLRQLKSTDLKESIMRLLKV